MGLGEVGPEPDGDPKLDDRLIPHAAVVQGIAEFEQRLPEAAARERVVGLEPKPFTVGRDRLVQIPPGEEGVAEIEVGDGIARIESDRLAVGRDRLIVRPLAP